MKLFELNDQERRWMKQRLQASLMGLLALTSGSALLRVATRQPQPSEGLQAIASQSAAPPAETNLAGSKPIPKGPRSIEPSGWRRTSRGWEHIGDWPAATTRSSKPSLNELIEQQEAKEPAWVQRTFALVRSISPLTFALLQLISVGLIAQLGSRAARQPRDISPKQPGSQPSDPS